MVPRASVDLRASPRRHKTTAGLEEARVLGLPEDADEHGYLLAMPDGRPDRIGQKYARTRVTVASGCRRDKVGGMKNTLTIVFATLFGFGVACASQHAIERSSAQAPTTGGSVAPTPGAYTECFYATLYGMQGRSLNETGTPERTVRVPSGWTPVGGAGYGERDAVMILCR